MINHYYLITEGKFDAKFIALLLPEDLKGKAKIVPGHGYTASLSLARSILSRQNTKVIYILDAHSNDLIDYKGKMDFIDQYFRAVANPERYIVFLHRPELERLFFEKEVIIEAIIGRKISKYELDLARLSPKQYLLDWLGIDQEEKDLVLEKLTPSILNQLRELNFSKKLIAQVKRF